MLAEGAVGVLVVHAQHTDDLALDGQRDVQQRLHQILGLDLLWPLVAHEHRAAQTVNAASQRVLRLDAEVAGRLGVQPFSGTDQQGLVFLVRQQQQPFFGVAQADGSIHHLGEQRVKVEHSAQRTGQLGERLLLGQALGEQAA